MEKYIFAVFIAVFSYIFGSIPFSYFIAKIAAGKDLIRVGTGNIGAMNVRRATGSWQWFFVAMVMDGLKGFLPVLIAGVIAESTGLDEYLLKGVALNFAVIGHNFSIVAYMLTGRILSGRGLATGGGALLAYNPLYLVIALVIGLSSIFLSRYLLVGQVLTPMLLPAIVFFINRNDFPAILFVCIVVVIRHIERIKSLIEGKEPEFYIEDKNQRE